MTEIFQTIVENSPNPLVSSIADVITYPRGANTEKASRLINYVDYIVDTYLKMSEDEEVPRFPIIYIPESEHWARQVCEEYVFLKMSFQYTNAFNEITKKRVYNLNNPDEKQKRDEKIKISKKCRSIRKCLTEQEHSYNSLIYLNCTRKNAIASSIMGRNILATRLINITSDSSHDFERNVERNIYSNIDNVFVFYGRNSDNSDSFNKDALSCWKKLKNCFVFVFNENPYQLNDLYDKAKSLCEKFPITDYEKEGIVNYKHFISLTNDETDLIFNRPPKIIRKRISSDSNNRQYLVDLYQNCGLYSCERNILSLSALSLPISSIKTYFRSIRPGFSEDHYYESILDLLILPPEESAKILLDVRTFAADNNIGLVIDNRCPEELKKQLIKVLSDNQIKAQLYSYHDLKKHSKGPNAIKETKIVICMFVPTHLRFAEYSQDLYPNTFDGYSLRHDQQLLELTYELTTCNYSYEEYQYKSKLNKYIYSQYRREYLKDDGVDIVSCSSVFLPSCEQDGPDTDSPPASRQVIRFEYENGSHDSFPLTEWILYRSEDNKYHIEKLSILYESDTLSRCREVQSLSDLASIAIEPFINKKSSQNDQFEKSYKENLINKGLIPEESVDNQIPVWKYLLKNKIESSCLERRVVSDDELNTSDSTWDLLKGKLNDDDVVSMYNSMNISVSINTLLKSWCDIEVPTPTAPQTIDDRSKIIEKYLGLNHGIVSLYSTKQKIIRGDARRYNYQMGRFLRKVLFREYDDTLSGEILNDYQLIEILPIESGEDVKVLKAIAEESINLKPFMSYRYESNN